MAIYLDYAATTPAHHKVIEKMLECLSMDTHFANPSSTHAMGREAKVLVETARAQVAALLGAETEEIIWTSGATESDNLAIKGAAHLYERKGKHIITMKTEHKAVLDTCQHLEKQGFSVTYLTPEKTGLLDLDKLKDSFRDDTTLVSIMQVNNETGVMQDIAAIAKLTSERNILLHVDAAQSAGKILIDVKTTPIDFISLSAHKVYGPKGIGALYLRKKPRVRVEPLIHGGGHEKGMRSGTLATHQIVGMGEAFSLAKENFNENYQHAREIRDYFIEKMSVIPQFKINATIDNCVPHIISARFQGMLASGLLNAMPEVAASMASACQGLSTEGSHVLKAMGFDEDALQSVIRFSFGIYTEKSDIDKLMESLGKIGFKTFV